jgi:thiamine-phosphate pyrophosphorylase
VSFRLPSPLYAILDPSGGDGERLPTLAAAMLEGGARFLQLRWKAAPSGPLVAVARECVRLCHARGALLVMNDRVDIALASGADGVHLGQSDLPLAAARALLGPHAIIGVSTHDLEQARGAAARGADYVAFGPIFATGTKETGYTPRGLEELRRVRGVVERPLVAIGGIRRENAASVLACGADAVAMISELCAAPDPAVRVRELLRALGT